MTRVNYSFYLLKLISKKWGLVFASLISFLAIFLVYWLSIDQVSEEFKILIEQNPDAKDNVPSGLTSKPICLAIVFISLIPFVVSLIWVIFKSEEDSTNLLIVSKSNSRVSIMIQKFMISVLILFVNSVFSLIVFYIVANKDKILTSSQEVEWIRSMFFGHFIASIIIASVSLLLLNFFKFITTLTMTLTIGTALPIMTIVMAKDAIVPSNSRISSDLEKWERPVIDYGESEPKIEASYFGRRAFEVGTIPKIEKRYFGAAKALEPNLYNKYAKWDSWMAVSSIFNAFSADKSSTFIRNSWTEPKKLKELFEWNDKNSIEINGRRYMIAATADISDGTPENTTNEGAYSIISYLDYNDPKTSQIIHFRRDVDALKLNYERLTQLLKNDDEYANKYRTLPFVSQMDLWDNFIKNADDSSVPIKQIFDDFVSKQTEKKIYDNISLNAFAIAKNFDQKNKSRFTPSSFTPSSFAWNALMYVENNQYFGNTSSYIVKKANKGILSSEDIYEEKHYNEPQKPGETLKLIWLIVLIATIPTSIALYIRKDLK